MVRLTSSDLGLDVFARGEKKSVDLKSISELNETVVPSCHLSEEEEEGKECSERCTKIFMVLHQRHEVWPSLSPSSSLSFSDLEFYQSEDD